MCHGSEIDIGLSMAVRIALLLRDAMRVVLPSAQSARGPTSSTALGCRILINEKAASSAESTALCTQYQIRNKTLDSYTPRANPLSRTGKYISTTIVDFNLLGHVTVGCGVYEMVGERQRWGM